MIMGCVIERAFKEEYVVHLVRAPEVPGDVYIEANKHTGLLCVSEYFGMYV